MTKIMPMLLSLLALASCQSVAQNSHSEPLPLLTPPNQTELVNDESTKNDAKGSFVADGFSGSALADRWIECDLKWFKPDDIQGSVDAYFERTVPLYRSATGITGITLNLGWMISSTTCWTGDLDEPLAISGNKKINYPELTGRALQTLVSTLKDCAGKYGVSNFQVAIWYYGGNTVYGFGENEWLKRHPESYYTLGEASQRHMHMAQVNFLAQLTEDSRRYATYPDGIPANTLFGDFFARQIASFSAAMGLDAIVIRDLMFGNVFWGLDITPRGFWERERYESFKAFLRELKKQRPDLTCIGYSTGGYGGIGEFRTQSVDIEELAKAGLLDVYISQSWGVAWSDYWSVLNRKAGQFCLSAYPQQQAYTASFQAQLAKTGCKFYVLGELSGALEYMTLSLTRARFNNRMQQWMYMNTFNADKTGRLHAPQGLYLSFADNVWRNGYPDTLLTEQQVGFAQDFIDNAVSVARSAEKAYGARLFYNRDALDWMVRNDDKGDYGEIADHALSGLTQYGIPFCSGARIEDFSMKSAGDFPVLATPFRLNPETKAAIKAYAEQGGPMLIIGKEKAIDPALRNLPNTIYWNDAVLEKDVDIRKFEPVAMQMTQMAREKGLSYLEKGPYALWQIWQSDGTPHMQIGNFIRDLNKAQPVNYTVKVSRKQLGLGSGAYHLQDVNSAEKIGADESDSEYLTFRVFVPPFNSFICRIEAGEAPPAPEIVNDDDARIIYRGQWTQKQAKVSLNGDAHASENASASVEFTFTGTGVRLLGPKGPGQGIMKIYLDDKPIAEINQYDSGKRPDDLDPRKLGSHGSKILPEVSKWLIPEKQVLFENTGLPKGKHTIRLEVTGRKDPASSGATILLDAIEVICAGCSSIGANAKTTPFVISNGVAFEAPEHYPSFSWEKVPVYMMFADGSRLLKDSEVEKIASETDFICIEKNHGLEPLGDAVLGLEHENQAFKQVKPGIKVLGYLNGALTYPFTRYTQMLTAGKVDQHPEIKAYLMTDPKTGELVKTRGLYGYNVLNPDMRAWWSDAAADMVRVGNADGIFIDQMHGFAWLHPADKNQAVIDGVGDMMAQLKAKIGPEKILLANNGAHIDKVFEVADAFMFEHYKRSSTHTKEKLLQDWQLMEKIADAGKICIYRFGASADGGLPLEAIQEGQSRPRLTDDVYAEWAKEQLEFYLSLYLIGAQPYSYFQWNWTWTLMSGPLEHYPELHKPLGKPLGKYSRVHPDGWEFTREFEHASVWVDTDKWVAKIEWK